MIDWISNTIATLNYWGIALLMLLENIFPPIPSEVIMPLAGFTVTQDKLNFVGVIVAGTIGSVVGAVPWYTIGRQAGEKRLRKWIDRNGQWLTLSGEDVDQSKQWFNQYGSIVVLFGRPIPGIRTFISVPAGFEEMPWFKFLLYSTIGTICWNALLTYAGFLLGQNFQVIAKFLKPISGVVLIGLLIGVVFWVMKRKKQKKKHDGNLKR